MKIKKFRARTAGDALAAVRRELGEDAVILSTSKLEAEANGRGVSVEMVAAVDWEDDPLENRLTAPEPDAVVSLAPALAAFEESSAEAGPDEGVADAGPAASELAELESRLDVLRRIVLQLIASKPVPEDFALDGAFRSVYSEMIANDIDAMLAASVLRTVKSSRVPANDRQELSTAIKLTLESLLPERRAGQKRVTVLFGPTGVGKTTTAAKLAANEILSRRAPVTLVTSDTYRVAAVEQLRAYAGAMGAGFEVVRNVGELDMLLQRDDVPERVILDTEGRGPRELSQLDPWFDYLAPRADVERHLVLSASTKPADLGETIERFGAARPETMIFTKVDETNSYGPIVSESVRRGLPVSYLSTGQKVPEEITAATPQSVAALAVSSLS